jgi:hypothetical protein
VEKKGHGVGAVEVYLISIASHVSDSKSRMLRSSIRCLFEASPPNITKVELTSVTDSPPCAIWTKENVRKHPCHCSPSAKSTMEQVMKREVKANLTGDLP